MKLSRIDWSKVSIKNLWYVIQAYVRLWKSPSHIKEQVSYRKELVKLKHPECLSRGYCYCGCDIPEMFYSDMSCENKCYPELMNAKDWQKYKNDGLNKL